VSRVDQGDVSAVVLTSPRDAEGRSVLEGTIPLRQQHPLWMAQLGVTPDKKGPALSEMSDVFSPGHLDCLPERLADISRPGDWPPPTGLRSPRDPVLFRPYAPRGVREVLAVCTANTSRPFMPRDLEARLRVAGRTLRGRLARAGWPPPRDLIAWCRLLHATFLLDLLGSSAKRVAHDLGYSSASALQVSMKRHLGLTNSEIHERGGYPFLLERFARRQLYRLGEGVCRCGGGESDHH
jgi:AraC-like DNA-binding protein